MPHTPPPSRERYERQPQQNNSNGSSSPLPSTASPPPHHSTPHSSTYSPVLPKTRRQVGGALPSAEVPPRPLVVPTLQDGAVPSPTGATSQQRQQRQGYASNANSRYAATPYSDEPPSQVPTTPVFLHHQHKDSPVRDDSGGPSFASSGGPQYSGQRDIHARYRDAVSPQHGATLRQSFCAALGGVHAGRLSGYFPSTTAQPSYASYQERSVSPPSAYAPPPQCPPINATTAGLPQTLLDLSSVRSPLLLPDDAVSNAGRRSASPVAVEPFLADRMPRGRHVLLNLLSTWGDTNEVGVEKLMLFDGSGHRIVPAAAARCPRSVSPKTSSAPPRLVRVPFTIAADAVDQHALASRGNSPSLSPQQHQHRSQFTDTTADDASDGGQSLAVSTVLHRRHNVANLVNHAHPTTDEQSMYATPLVDGRHHLICITFEAPVELSAIRVFNYCGSGRSRTNKGVRLIEITVDDALAFRGEVAESLASGRDDDCETILFTEDPAVLQRMLEEASSALSSSCAHGGEDSAVEGGDPVALERRFDDEDPQQEQSQRDAPSAGGGGGSKRRPQRNAMRTSIAFAPMSAIRETSDMFSPLSAGGAPQAGTGASTPQQQPQPSLSTIAGVGAPCIFPAEAPKGVTSLCLQVVSTWGDSNFVGLSGLRLRDPQGRLLYNVAHVAINRPSGRRDDAYDGDTAALFDGDAATACVWSYEPGLQIILMLQHPCDVGFVEISNYSFGRRTHCGVKCARLFISSMPIVSSVSYASSSAASSSSNKPSNVVVASSAPHAARHLSLVYAVLWDSTDTAPAQPSAAQQRRLSGSGNNGAVIELTPSEGILLRKAPSQLSALRFQSFDLSLASYGGTSSSTGGGSQSLKLSMNARAAVAIRRARQSLLEPPPWLLEHQLYIPCILPVAYVFKVTVVLDATATQPLKHLLCAWATRPQEAVGLLNDDGVVVDMSSLWCEGLVTYDSAATGDENNNASDDDDDDDGADDTTHRSVGASRVTVTLALVADAPFALAALFLRAPLQLPGENPDAVAWVNSVMVAADDALVYESAEVSQPFDGSEDEESSPSSTMPTTRGISDRRRIPTVVFFTLDDRALSAYKPR